MTIAAEFEPQSWEMPPGYRLMEESAIVVTHEVLGESQQWFIVPVRMPDVKAPVWWMKRADADFGGDAGFVIYDEDHDFKAPFTAKKNAKVLDWAFEQGNYGRQFILNAQGELRREGEEAYESLLVDSIGDGEWNTGAIRPQSYGSSPFQWNVRLTPAAFRELPALEVWARIGQILADPRSDAAFARRFALLGESERRALVFQGARLDKTEFGGLLRALIISTILWDESALSGAFFFALRADGDYSFHFKSADDIEEVRIDEDFNGNIRLLQSRFAPVNEDLAEHMCVWSWMDEMEDVANVVVSNSSAHEQLEAQLLWRDWLASVEAEAD